MGLSLPVHTASPPLPLFKTRFPYVALAVLELSVDQPGLELKESPTFASQVPGSKVCTEAMKKTQTEGILEMKPSYENRNY